MENGAVLCETVRVFGELDSDRDGVLDGGDFLVLDSPGSSMDPDLAAWESTYAALDKLDGIDGKAGGAAFHAGLSEALQKIDGEGDGDGDDDVLASASTTLSIPFVGTKDFDAKVLRSEKVAVVLFGASWCGPCINARSTFEGVVKGPAGPHIVPFLVDADEHQVLPSKYNVPTLPTFVFFKKGLVVEKVLGAVSADKLNATVQKVRDGHGPL